VVEIVEAEARVGGVLRGGYLNVEDDTFTYHCPHEVTVAVSSVADMRIIEEEE